MQREPDSGDSADPEPWEDDDEQAIAYGGSSANPALDDFDDRGPEPWGPAYEGSGHYSTGDFDSDARGDYDYRYAGFKGDAGFDEIGDQQYGGGRYGAGPFEQSEEFGGGHFAGGRGPFGRLRRELDVRHVRLPARHRSYRPLPVVRRSNRDFPGALGWRGAPDWADPAGFRTFTPPSARGAAERRGPKNYRRSDERILEEVYLRLLRDPHIDSSDLAVEVHEGVATLTGSVPTRAMKHAIEDLIHDVYGVVDVRSQAKVRAPARR